jgi:hypothetical protein
MSVIRTLNAVGAALVGTVSAPAEAVPPVDPRLVRRILAELGMARHRAGEAEVNTALRRFQARSGLTVDGMAGPLTARALARSANEARHLREIGFRAA